MVYFARYILCVLFCLVPFVRYILSGMFCPDMFCPVYFVRVYFVRVYFVQVCLILAPLGHFYVDDMQVQKNVRFEDIEYKSGTTCRGCQGIVFHEANSAQCTRIA